MHLMKLFNKDYLFQNLKKSKSILALFLGLIPLLNTIIFLLMASSNNNEFLPTFTQLSAIHFIGVYVVPLVLAIALFGYTFKRKQVDFIGSLPLNRKTIYITNIIGGLIIILMMMVLNVILMVLVSVFYPNAVIAGAMIWDYFVFWTITYIFVFVVAALATTIASNTITTMVITALILFLVPFLHDYTFDVTGSNIYPINNMYETIDYKQTDSSYIPDMNIHRVRDNNYTAPYRLFTVALSALITEPKIYNDISNIKMLILSIGYILIGLYLFTKKKLEVNETSFKNFHTHTLVKCLTMIPMGFVFYNSWREGIEIVGSIFILALLLAYFFIYDLITKKGISRVRQSLIYFVGFMTFMIIVGYGTDYLRKIDNTTAITTNNIKEVNIIQVVDTYGINSLNQVYVDDENIIKEIVKQYNSYLELLSKERRNEYLKDYYASVGINIIDKNNHKYYLYLPMNVDDYDRLISLYTKTDEFYQAYTKINHKNILSVKINEDYITGNEKKEILALIKTIMKDSNRDNYGSIVFDKEYYTAFQFYTYDNHQIMNYFISPSGDRRLAEYIINYNMKNLKKLFNYSYYDNIYLDNISSSSKLDIDLGSYGLISEDIIMYIVDHLNDKFDYNKPYFRIAVHNNTKYYIFFSNDIEGFTKMYNEKVKNIETPKGKI